MPQLSDKPNEGKLIEELTAIVGICREDNPRDVDETYGAGTYERLFPEPEDERERRLR